MRLLLHAFFITFIASSGLAQNATPSAGMIFFSDHEGRILREQSALLRQEQEFTDPIWIKDAVGVFHVIDGAELSTRIEGFVTITQLMGMEGWALDEMGLIGTFIRLQSSEGSRADIIMARLMDEYVASSAVNRREAMRQIESRLEFVRRQFFKELDVRDVQLGISGGEQSISGNSHPCLEPHSAADRQFYISRGTWNSVRYFQRGSYYCVIPSAGWVWTEVDYGFAQIDDDYITFTMCPAGQCSQDPYVFYANITNDGDPHMSGRVYESHGDIEAQRSIDTFSWWQCSPATAGVAAGSSGSCVGK